MAPFFRPRAPNPRWLVWGGSGIAALAGLVWGFMFGSQLAGPMIGVVTSLNMAVICALLAGAILERLPLGRRRED